MVPLAGKQWFISGALFISARLILLEGILLAQCKGYTTYSSLSLTYAYIFTYSYAHTRRMLV